MAKLIPNETNSNETNFKPIERQSIGRQRVVFRNLSIFRSFKIKSKSNWPKIEPVEHF